MQRKKKKGMPLFSVFSYSSTLAYKLATLLAKHVLLPAGHVQSVQPAGPIDYFPVSASVYL